MIKNSLIRVQNERKENVFKKKYGNAYVNYRKILDQSEKNLALNAYPPLILLEVTSFCNYRCKMCVHTILNDFKNDMMSVELVKNIAKQCKELKVPAITIGAGYECLIHKDIKEIVNIILNETDVIELWLITNGKELTEDIANFLINMEIGVIAISIDAVKPETYKSIRGGNLQIIENNIKRLIDIRNQMKKDFPLVRVSFVEQEKNKDEADLFIEKWKDIADIIDFQKLFDYEKYYGLKKLPPINELKPHSFFCSTPYRLLSIRCNGDIEPCCVGGLEKICKTESIVIGNISIMSLLEAWNSKKINLFRNYSINNNPCDLCIYCNSIQKSYVSLNTTEIISEMRK